MTVDEARDYWKEYYNIKAHADILASWWIGFNAHDLDWEEVEPFAHEGGKSLKWVLDCVEIYKECRREHDLKARLTDGMNKKLYLERYVRGKDKETEDIRGSSARKRGSGNSTTD